jgi:hypothetical protein
MSAAWIASDWSRAGPARSYKICYLSVFIVYPYSAVQYVNTLYSFYISYRYLLDEVISLMLHMLKVFVLVCGTCFVCYSVTPSFAKIA